MLQVKVYNQEGKENGTIELAPEIFGVPINPALIQQVVVAQAANRRVAIAHTKTRAEVRGGGIKPWKQKGTGRARHGSIRSPIWVGGGVAFGPRKNRNFSHSINKKMKQQALCMTLSDKVHEEKIVVIDKMEFATPKTKQLAALLAKLPSAGRSVLLVTAKSDQNIIRSSRNLPDIRVIRADSLNVVDVMKYNSVVIIQDSLAVIKQYYSK